MTSEQVKAVLADLPAGPFTVHVKERTPIEALHTDYAMLSPSGRTLNVYDAEKMHWLDIESITRISCSQRAEKATR